MHEKALPVPVFSDGALCAFTVQPHTRLVQITRRGSTSDDGQPVLHTQRIVRRVNLKLRGRGMDIRRVRQPLPVSPPQ